MDFLDVMCSIVQVAIEGVYKWVQHVLYSIILYKYLQPMSTTTGVVFKSEMVSCVSDKCVTTHKNITYK